VIEVVFHRVPGSPDLTFVEVEDGHGRSLEVGTWVDRGDDFVTLRLGDDTREAVASREADLSRWERVRAGCPRCGEAIQHHALTGWCLRCSWAQNWRDG
jgi:hypothetical protein